MQAVLIIPARFASTRFPGKPLVEIDGKPMIQRVYERASLAKGIDAIYVATDDARIQAVVEGFGGQAVMTNPDAESGTDRLEEAAQKLNLSDETLIINLQGDQPLANPECIERLVNLFKDEPNAFEMATLGVELHGEHDAHNPNHVKLIFDNQDYAIYFSRANIPFGRDTQDFPMYKHLGIYAYTRGFLGKFAKMPMGRLEAIEKLEQLRALENGYKIKVAIGDFDSPEVDVPSDIDRCLAVLEQVK